MAKTLIGLNQSKFVPAILELKLKNLNFNCALQEKFKFKLLQIKKVKICIWKLLRNKKEHLI